eukprot:g6481.t1
MKKKHQVDDLDDEGSDTSSVFKAAPRRKEPLRSQHQRCGDVYVPLPPEQRQGRGSRIRKDKHRTIAPRQEAIIKHVLTGSGCSVTNKWKKQEQPFHVSALDPLKTIPLASSQRWCGTMRQILLRSLEQQEEGAAQREERVPSLAPTMPKSFGGLVRAQNLARNLKRHAMASAAKKAGEPLITADYDGDEEEEEEEEEDDDGDSEGPLSAADLNAASIAAIAMRARCQEALSFLHFVKRVREEKREDAAAAAAAGHGWDWVEDNCRCVFDLLASVPAVGSLDLVFRRKLLWMLDVVSRRKGQVLFRQGDEQETLWLLLHGRVALSYKDKQGTVHRGGKYDPGQVLGNLLPEKRLATATCLKQCALLRVDGVTFRQALEDPEAQRVIEKKSFFRSVSLFGGLGERDLDRLAAAFQLVTLEAGDVLCREGERVDHIYLVQRGNLRLLKAFLPLPQGQARDRPEEGMGTEVEQETKGDPTQGEHACERRRRRQQQHRQEEEEEKRLQERQPVTPGPSPGVSFSPNTGSAAASVDDNGGSSKNRERENQPSQERRQQQQQPPPPSSSSPSSGLSSPMMKVRYFEIGLAGRKEFIGEGGFTSAAFAGAGALGAAGIEAGGKDERVRKGGGGGGGGGRGRERDRGEGEKERGNSPTQGHHVHFSRVGGNYMVSAVAETRADVFAAKVSRLWPMQSPAIKLCWIEGREVHRMKEREWTVEVLASKLLRQTTWESTKRAIVMDSVRTDVLENKMLASTAIRSGGRGT